jgi:hypothetical protein
VKLLLILILIKSSFAITLIDRSKPKKIESNKLDNTKILKEKLEYYKMKAETYKRLSYTKKQGFDLNDDFKKFRSGDMIKGHLFNYVLSTNLNTPIIVIPHSKKLPKGSKILCEGRVYQKRVAAECTKIITSTREIEINAILLSEDGSFGLVGEYNDGRDYELTKNVVQGAMNNILEGQRDTINTQIGLRSDRSVKNMVLDGVIGGFSEVHDGVKVEYSPSVYLKKNLSLILYFN